VTIRKQWLVIAASTVVLLAIAAAPCWGAGYGYSNESTAPAASQEPSGYTVFTSVEPSTQAPSGWVASGQYNLPPDIGDVGIGVSAAGSTATAASGAAGQHMAIRLNVADRSSQLFTIDPSGARLSDDAGHVVVGATAYSNNMQVAQISIGPGGRDDVQLAFSLPSTIDVAALSAVNIDLPYTYGSRSEVAHFRFAPGASAAPAPVSPAYAPGPSYTTYNYNDYYARPGYTDYLGSYYPWSNYLGAYDPWSWWANSWWWQPSYPWWWGGITFFDRDDFRSHHRFHRQEELLEHQHVVLAANAAAARAPLAAAANRHVVQTAVTAGNLNRPATGHVGATTVGETPGTTTQRLEQRGVLIRLGEHPVSGTPRVNAPITGPSRIFVAPGTGMRSAGPRTFVAPRSFVAPAPSFSSPRTFSSAGHSGGTHSFASPGGGGFRGGGFSGRGARGGFGGGHGR
ncbi:MAG: hypothetical protein NTX87_19070, partial [Planctomycetota bacterium]|nr:hypothetical protein [Planctomycetota bacterium]